MSWLRLLSFMGSIYVCMIFVRASYVPTLDSGNVTEWEPCCEKKCHVSIPILSIEVSSRDRQ